MDIVELEVIPRVGEFVFFAENEDEDPKCHVVKFVYHNFFPAQPPQIVMVSSDDERDFDNK